MANSFFDELKRRNVFKVAAGYTILGWLVLQVADVVVPILELPDWTLKFLLFIGLLGFPFAIFLAWAYELTPDGIKKETEVETDESITQETGRKLNFLVVGLLVVAVGYLGYSNYILKTNTADEQATAQASSDTSDAVTEQSIIPLAVLPFVNMSQAQEQEYFVDGLTEELLNSLTRVDGLKVTGRTSSFAYKNKNIDLRKIGEELGVDYLVEGSVRKMGEDIRITIQLIETEDGSHLFSDTFDRKLVNLFQLQEEISEQIAAALKLKLVHDDDNYIMASDRLDYIAIEKLVSARAKLYEYAEEPVKEVLAELKALDEAYPNTAEIMGLHAYAEMVLSSVASNESNVLDELNNVDRVLEINNKNYDALVTAAVITDDYPHLLDKAYQYYKKLIDYYPGRQETYGRLNRFMLNFQYPCEEIKAFEDSVPNGIDDADTKQAVYKIINACLNSDYEGLSDWNRENDRRTNYFTARGAPNDLFRNFKMLYEDNPNERWSSFYSWILLMLEQKEEASRILSNVDVNRISYFAYYTAILSAEFDLEFDGDINSYIDAFYEYSGAVSLDLFAVKFLATTEKTEALKHHLYRVIDFEKSAKTSYRSINLMLLQKLAEYEEDSRRTADELYLSLSEYKDNHPESFEFYHGLDFELFAAAIYSDRFVEAEEIYSKYLTNDRQLWFYDAEYYFQFWLDNPTVQKVIRLVEEDKVKAQKELGLL